METLDFCTIINGTSSASATVGVDNSGVCSIVYKILDYCYKKYGITLSMREGQLALDTGFLKRRGKILDLQDKIDELESRIAKLERSINRLDARLNKLEGSTFYTKDDYDVDGNMYMV